MTRFAATSALVLAACATAPVARADTRAWSVDRFEAVSLHGSYDAQVVTGGREWKVVAQGDDDAVNALIVAVHDGVLKVGPARRASGGEWGSWGSGGDLRLTIHAPRLSALAVAGSGDVRLNRADGDRFKCSVAGSGSVRIDRVNVGEFKASLAGSGDLQAAGQCRALAASVAGAGEARLRDLKCATAAINVAGSGAVAARAVQTAAISAVGSGAVRVYGGPRCQVSRMDSAQVFCGDGGSMLSSLFEPPEPPEPPTAPAPPRPPRPPRD